MRARIKIICLIVITLFYWSCKKDAGPGGKNSIGGNVYFTNGVTGNEDVAPMAKVYIAYGTDQPTSDFDQTILANGDGSYEISGLRKGKYFIRSEYTDEHGFVYSTPGYAIEFTHKKKRAEINMVLK